VNFAGSGDVGYSGDGNVATYSRMISPLGIAFDSTGNLFIVDSGNYRIRKVKKSTGTITTYAGNGIDGSTGDGGDARRAQLLLPSDVIADSNGDLYIADAGIHVIRKVTDSTGVINVYAGNRRGGYSGDTGDAIAAQLNGPSGLAIDSNGDLYIADTLNNRVRLITKSTGKITTYAGDGTSSFGGDGGAATSAKLFSPISVAFDSSDNLYIADRDNHLIRLVTKSTGFITTVLGAAADNLLNYPIVVRLDSSDNLYVADAGFNQVYLFSKDSQKMIPMAGSGDLGAEGDGGPASVAQLTYPTGLALDAAGNVYISDSGNNRIRVVRVAEVSLAPTLVPTAVPTLTKPTAIPTAEPTVFPADVHKVRDLLF
jgi:trimeric autotransporter adhesin